MVNKVVIVGNLGKNPELRYTQNGTAVATLNIATNRKRRDQDGNYSTETEWHRVIAWNKTAEFCGNYLQKGNLVYVEGRLQTRKWTDQADIERYTTEIITENLQSLTPKAESGSGRGFGEPPLPEEPYGGDTGQFSSYGDTSSFGASTALKDSSDFNDSFKGSSNKSRGADEFGGDTDTGNDDDMPF